MTTCPKCNGHSGGDWSHCKSVCPMSMSPHYDPTWQTQAKDNELIREALRSYASILDLSALGPCAVSDESKAEMHSQRLRCLKLVEMSFANDLKQGLI